MIPRLIALLAVPLALWAAAIPAQAQSGPVVVELFTSQGCSSCPPADALLGELAEREDVIALSLHVDYWDYLGWQDPFASPEMSARQHSYRDVLNVRSVFTPQMVIAGRISTVGHQREAIEAAIAQAASEPPRARIALREEGGSLRVAITPLAPGLRGVVHLVSYDLPQVQQITQGENRGNTYVYSNVVTDWMRLAEWSGAAQELTAPAPTMGRGVAVILQDGTTGPVLAAARMER